MGIFEPLTARVIHSLPKLKLIACKSMGYNYVDLEAAKECGVSVTHLKSAFSIDVADICHRLHPRPQQAPVRL